MYDKVREAKIPDDARARRSPSEAPASKQQRFMEAFLASRDMVEEEFEPEPSSPVMYSMCNMTFHILTEATLQQGERPGMQGHMEDDESVPPPQGLDGPLYTFDDADNTSIGGLEAGGNQDSERNRLWRPVGSTDGVQAVTRGWREPLDGVMKRGV